MKTPAVSASESESSTIALVEPEFVSSHHHLRRDLVALDNGGVRSCTKDSPCGRCQGDCKRDDDCQGNLVCYNVSGRHKPGDFCAKIPGCSGEDLSKTDWCIRPQDMPIPNTCDKRTGGSGSNNNNDDNDKEDDNEEEKAVVDETRTVPTTPAGGCDNDDEEANLRSVVYELTTKIEEVSIETLFFEELTMKLEETLLATAPPPESTNLATRRRHHYYYRQLLADGDHDEEEKDDNDATTSTTIVVVVEDIQSNVKKLDIEKDRLINGNSRVKDITVSLLQFGQTWNELYETLHDENSNLVASVSYLQDENSMLQEQTTRLSDQIEELNDNINNLENLMETQSQHNDELDGSTTQLQMEVARLTAANEEYQRLNDRLESNIKDLQTSNTELQRQNQIVVGLNGDLMNTKQKLDTEIEELKEENTKLEETISNLNTAVDELDNQVNGLQTTNEQLKTSIEDLTLELDRTELQITELQNINDGLQTIASYIEESSQGLDETYEELTQYLAEQITVYREVAKSTLQNIYTQRVALWDCAFRDTFAEEPFATANGGNIPIPRRKFEEDVLEYIDERVLSELCVSKNSFKDYLEDIFVDPVYTTNHLISGLNSYTNLVLDFYFPPDDNEEGLSSDIWAEAGYDCEKLPQGKQFQYATSN